MGTALSSVATISHFGVAAGAAAVGVVEVGQPFEDPVEAVEAALERDNFMSAEEAKAWGLIDEVMAARPKADDTAK